MEFVLSGKDFIELNKLLKIKSLVESGGFANRVITEGQVLLNGEIETRKRKKLYSGDIVVYQEISILIK